MPIDVVRVEDYEDAQNGKFDSYDTDEYVCIRPSRHAAICVHEPTVVDLLTALSNPTIMPITPSSTSSPSQSPSFTQPPSSTYSSQSPSSTSSPSQGVAARSFDFSHVNLPLFKYEDSVKQDEKCYVLDWEKRDEFIRENSDTLNNMLAQTNDSLTNDPNFNIDTVMSFIDSFNTGDQPTVMICGKDAVDVNYLISSMLRPTPNASDYMEKKMDKSR